MNFTPDQTRELIAAFRSPSRRDYPELNGYTRDQLYEDCFGGGGLYLAARMVRTLHLHAGDIVLDLGCGKGSTSIFLVKHFGVKVIAVDLWTSATFLDQKFRTHGYRDRIVPLQMDIKHPLPFAEGYFDAIFCMNSFNFYGGSIEFLQHLLKHLKPDGQLCIGSEVLSEEFTEAQLQDPPEVFAFKLPPPNEHVDVFEGDFKKQHTAGWWQKLFEASGLVQVEHCQELDDADVLYEELVRYEYENNIDAFDVNMCLFQMEWGQTHQPRKTLFVLTAHKL
jgi:cyclopropane fatty-acyl-phospholipid synthase-like methyltransferase